MPKAGSEKLAAWQLSVPQVQRVWLDLSEIGSPTSVHDETGFNLATVSEVCHFDSMGLHPTRANEYPCGAGVFMGK